MCIAPALLDQSEEIMSSKSEKKQPNQADGDVAPEITEDQGIREGRPNPGNTPQQHDKEHKSGYGGDGGEPRTSSHDREKPQKG